nr:hypothetical protein [Clostridia bacterium]
MLTDYFEPFTLLERRAEPDGMGGESVSWQPVTGFRGGLTHTCGKEISVGGRPTVQRCPMLLHELDVTLVPGDQVRRERDGALFRVISGSDGMRTPAFSGLQFAQAPVERLVMA